MNPSVRSSCRSDGRRDHRGAAGSHYLSGKSGVIFYLWCTGCRIHACLFTGRLALGSRCGEANCENDSKDRHKTFHGASPSVLLRAAAQHWRKAVSNIKQLWTSAETAALNDI